MLQALTPLGAFSFSGAAEHRLVGFTPLLMYLYGIGNVRCLFHVSTKQP
jgi:hypothetical protein